LGTKRLIPLAREGYPYIAAYGFLTAVAFAVGVPVLGVVLLALTGLMVNFFRDPERTPPGGEDDVVSPADGVVVAIEEIEDALFLGDRVLRIAVFMNVFNVHVNRAPLGGTVEKALYVPGAFHAADSEDAFEKNERHGLVIRTDEGVQLAVVQVAGLIARRIVCHKLRGNRLRRGERFGMIKFGSRVDVHLPASCRAAVRKGEKVRAGESVLCHLK
jgi:phosphatidylserine decarboxylase